MGLSIEEAIGHVRDWVHAMDKEGVIETVKPKCPASSRGKHK